MPQLSRMYCSQCKRSIYNVLIDGVRVPLVLYFVVGQPPDTGPPLGINDPGVKLPSFVREIMQAPVARAELCMQCASEIFGVPLLTAEDDPMNSAEQVRETAETIEAIRTDDSLPEVDKNAAMLSRTLLAVKVGRGAVEAPALPAEETKA